MKTSGSYIVSWDFSNGEDTSVFLVGEQKNGKIEIVNAFQGKEAEELYSRLSPKSKKTSFAKGENDERRTL